jgi:outer membrane protein assembly factor BamB
LENAKKLLACALLAVVACSSSSGTAPVVTGSWTMYRGDLARDGHPSGATLDSSSASRLRLAWRTTLGGAIDGTVAVSNGMVFAATAAGTVTALDAQTGKTVWNRRGLGAVSSSPTIVANTLVVGTLTGRVYLLRLADGGETWRWQGPPSATIWASPVAFRDLVVVGVASPYGDTPLIAGRLVGLDRKTGAERWNVCVLSGCEPGDGVWSTPAIDDGGLAFVGVGNPDDGVLAFDPLTGKRKWLARLYPDAHRDLDVGASPIVFVRNGRELVAQASVEGLFAELDAGSGAVVWSKEVVQGTAVHGLLASPAYDGKTFYVASASPPTGMYALSPRDGALIWRRETPLPVYSAPAVGDGVAVFGTGNVFGDTGSGSLLAVSSMDGHVVWSYDTHSAIRSGPAVAGDFVVAGDSAGDVLAFRVSPS